ncbi:MAG TPA: DUF2946 family protein [Stellaceae bacterium]|jgi:hypothetical protein|nr:DUF2946 family protein [Stellaceae bacterium]
MPPFLTHRSMRRRRHSPVWSVTLALVGLCLRLAWPAPVPAIGDAGLAVALGEHALCFAAAAAANPSAAPGDTAPAQPDDHADHDGLGCCQWHASAGFILPPVAPAVRVAYEIGAFVPSVAAETPPLRRSATPGQPRAPPLNA